LPPWDLGTVAARIQQKTPPFALMASRMPTRPAAFYAPPAIIMGMVGRIIRIEAEIAAWYDATNSDEEKTIVRRLNRLAIDHVLFAPLGVTLQHQAWRKESAA
jgi:hypothetical protein